MYNQDQVTLVSVNWNNQPCLELMLKSYAKHHWRGEPLKLALVDNGSTDGSAQWLKENEIPFYDFSINIGHENAINCLYGEVKTPCMLLSDTDVEYLGNVYDHYLSLIDDEVKLIGDFITGDNLNAPVKPRCGAWFQLTDIQAMKERGYKTYRTKSAWDYDVGSEYTENILLEGFKIYSIDRHNKDIDRDIVGMNYEPTHWHYGKLSWNLQNHRDREWEIGMRMKYIKEERLPLYEDIELKNKFIGV